MFSLIVECEKQESRGETGCNRGTAKRPTSQFFSLQIRYPLKQVFILLQSFSVQAIDALSALVGGCNQARTFEDMQMPRGEGLAQDETVGKVEHGETIFAGQFL